VASTTLRARSVPSERVDELGPAAVEVPHAGSCGDLLLGEASIGAELVEVGGIGGQSEQGSQDDVDLGPQVELGEPAVDGLTRQSVRVERRESAEQVAELRLVRGVEVRRGGEPVGVER
jgi:hypothetical protein